MSKISLVTPEEAKREAAKGLKQAIAVSVKKFKAFLPLTCEDVEDWKDFVSEAGEDCCGLCRRYNDECNLCVLAEADYDCFHDWSQFQIWVQAAYRIRRIDVTTITQFRKETSKMIKILEKLYKECE